MPPRRTAKSDAAVVAKTHAALDEIADTVATSPVASPAAAANALVAAKEKVTGTPKKDGTPRARRASGKQQAVKSSATTPAGQHESKLPGVVRFPLATVISFAIASLGYSLLGEVSKGDLAAVSRSQDTWMEVGLLTAWRT